MELPTMKGRQVSEMNDHAATRAKNALVSFPNLCRSFDAAKNRVRFWGYVSAIEISFFVELDAIRKLEPEIRDTEEHILNVFDSAQIRIQEVANTVYVRGKQGAYTYSLGAKDF